MSINAVGADCCGCNACVEICPKQCITMQRNNEGFLYPIIEETECVNCGMCQKVCLTFDKQKGDKPISVYAAVNKNSDIRASSSSGGIFSELAREVLRRGGLVYGVKMSDDCMSAYHVSIEREDQLQKLYGSKYLQSETAGLFANVKSHLETGRTVLFCGTPCQVSGLKHYLKRDYPCLYTVDLVCHGVPSPLFWRKYVRFYEKRNRARIEAVNFRDKSKGWKEFGMRIENSNKVSTWMPKFRDPFMRMFLRDYCLRESCYHCKVKGNDAADMTLGDFWGIADIQGVPDIINDNRGTSLVIIRTKKGSDVFQLIKENCEHISVSYEDAVRMNEAEYTSTNRPIQRDTFLVDMNHVSFRRLILKYGHTNMKQWALDLIELSQIGRIVEIIRNR